ncbi:MAG: glycerol acyltransferase [Bacteroidales bacterium]|nr:glycerol acyltransferase [Bacteroidales bacterium]MBN2699711.1 glycerol acyltransferase [Bacteroidales bacterium]
MTTESEHKKNFKPLDIREIFYEKNPSLAPLIPGFIYRYLHRILRLDFINEILYNHGYKKDMDFYIATIELFNVTVDVKGRENLPSGGRYIFVSNHPLGGFDGGLIIRELGNKYPYIKVLVNDILMNIKNMEGIFVPINKHGAQALENVRRINEVFDSDAQILTFPAGLVSRRKKGIIRDPQWNKNFISKSVQYRRDVVPIHISGRNSDFFYNLSNLRKFLGIKANLEMFFLPNETFKHRNKHYIIHIGRPISFQTFNRRYVPGDWAIKVQEHVYNLPENYNVSFPF